MSTKAVIGLGFGDEGKGLTTEYLCSQDPENTMVVRFSGGHQAGHKVLKGNVEHVFSSFGAGTLSGCPTYWSKNCTVEPVAFWNEFSILKEKGISPKIYIHPECQITTIYDVFANRNSVEVKHGTTGTGFFRTKKRNLDGISLSAKLVFTGSWFEILQKLQEIVVYYKVVDEDLNVDIFTDAVQKIRESLLSRNLFLLDEIPNQPYNKVFEGSQGLMLDEHIGYMPHCTPSDITPKAILDMGYPLDEVFLVTRAYQTRHGNGPMTNEKYPIKPVNNEKETNVSHRFQGEFRTTILDLDQLIRAKEKGIDEVVPKNTKVNLVVTCMDQLSEYRATFLKGMAIFIDPNMFVKFVGACLGINGNLYINDSPYSTSIKMVDRCR